MTQPEDFLDALMRLNEVDPGGSSSRVLVGQKVTRHDDGLWWVDKQWSDGTMSYEPSAEPPAGEQSAYGSSTDPSASSQSTQDRYGYKPMAIPPTRVGSSEQRHEDGLLWIDTKWSDGTTTYEPSPNQDADAREPAPHDVRSDQVEHDDGLVWLHTLRSDGSVTITPLPQDQGFKPTAQQILSSAVRLPGAQTPAAPAVLVPGGPRIITDPFPEQGGKTIGEPAIYPWEGLIAEPQHEGGSQLIADPAHQDAGNDIVDEFPEIGGSVRTIDVVDRGKRTWEESASPGTKPGQDKDSKEIGRVADILKARAWQEKGIPEYVEEIDEKYEDENKRVFGQNDLRTQGFHIEKTTRGRAVEEAKKKTEDRFIRPDRKDELNPRGVKLYLWVEEGVTDRDRQAIEDLNKLPGVNVEILTGPKENWVYTIPLP